MRKFKVTVDGVSYDVEVEEIGAESVSTPVQKIVASENKPVVQKAVGNGAPIKAPMPGNILKILVSDGAQVKRGKPIIVLEAMKMENDIVADRDGVVSIAVKVGDSVESGTVIATIA